MTVSLEIQSPIINPHLPRPKAAPAPSVHSMVTRSKAKHLVPTSPFALVSPLEPNSVHEALLDSQWVKAMEEEVSTLHRNHTWDLVPFSKDMNLIGCKWVFRIKYKPDGSILEHKAKLVANGFLQNPGLDYTETFSPVVKAPIFWCYSL